MGTYNPNNNKNRKKIEWPISGIGAEDIVSTDYQVLITTDVLRMEGFQKFYNEWIVQNGIQGSEKKIFISSIECKNKGISDGIGAISVLEYKGCEKYSSFFQCAKNMGKWIFLAENESKAEIIVKEAREAGILLRVYGLDRTGKLQNYKLAIKKAFW